MKNDLITSRTNPKIKQVRALQNRKERESARLFVVEGIRHVGDAVAANADLAFICYAPDLLISDFALNLIQQQTQHGVPCYPVSADVFESLASREGPQGILAVVHQPQNTLMDLDPINFGWGVALVAPQDPGNVGTILRTINAVGASGLLLLESGTDAYHPTAIRASMGASFWHPIVQTSFSNFAAWAHQHNYHIMGTSAHGSVDYRTIPHYPKPLILLMGSEREGLTSEQIAICHQLVRLPMVGQVSSLNLSVATGVMLYSMFEKLGS
ncbi:MAG: rRNA methyltransferase [Chloroflexota bacterium]|nr:RNA methyltransferase [Chloroflexota bacterium]NOG65784.1 RNA methyltransferase [Chloroflexota bacterium]GIK67098.1 MAG: rRNA methyltransferase [Chloroflexota bacterium]